MSRYNDIGHYEVGNVRIILSSENVREAQLGRTHSDESRAKNSAAQKGKPAHNKGKPSHNKGKPNPKNSLKTQCVHCGTWANAGTMKRWHADNCNKAPT
jgi:ribosomal protein L44E